MRDYDLLISILKEMADPNNGYPGCILVVKTLGMSQDELNRDLHARLLVDAGLAIWENEQLLRITNQGFDFLNAVDKQPELKEKAHRMLDKGIPYVNVVLKILELAGSAASQFGA